MQNLKNGSVRFLVWVNGNDVKLSLQDGERLEWSKRSFHDEGYSFEHKFWSRKGEFIYYESTSGGRDCDGRIEHYNDYVAHVSQIDENGDVDWQKEQSSVYDQYAVMAGY